MRRTYQIGEMFFHRTLSIGKKSAKTRPDLENKRAFGFCLVEVRAFSPQMVGEVLKRPEEPDTNG